MPDPWARIPLGEIAREVRDRLDPANEPSLPYVGLADVEPRQRRIPAFGVLDDVSSSKTRFRPGDILFGKLRPYLHKVAQADREGGASTDILVVRPRNGLEPDFLYWRLTSDAVVEHAERHSAGTKMPRTSWARLAEFEVPLPPLSEQRKIAAILSTVDDAIAATRKVVEQTKRVKQGLLQTLMTRGIGHSRFKKTEIGEIPETWGLASVEDVPPVGRQCILTGPFGAQLKPSDFKTAGVPVLKIGNVQWGHLDVSELDFVGEDKAEELERYRVRAGDLLFARQGATTGRNALATAACDGWLINYHIIRVAVDHSRCLPEYLNYSFNSRVVQQQVDRAKGRGTREGVNTATLRDLKFPLGPINEQQEIVRRIASVDDVLRENSEAVDTLMATKQGLVQDLLTGRVRVQPD
jgi:type I restriction enzyme, S subunit